MRPDNCLQTDRDDGTETRRHRMYPAATAKHWQTSGTTACGRNRRYRNARGGRPGCPRRGHRPGARWPHWSSGLPLAQPADGSAAGARTTDCRPRQPSQCQGKDTWLFLFLGPARSIGSCPNFIGVNYLGSAGRNYFFWSSFLCHSSPVKFFDQRSLGDRNRQPPNFISLQRK